MKKSGWLVLALVLLLAACGQNKAAKEQTIVGGQYDLVGRWEMVGDLEGISYSFEFYDDTTGVSFSSPHSYRDLEYQIDQNTIRIDYYQGGEISSTEVMGIAFEDDDHMTLTAEDSTLMGFVRAPLPDTPAFVRARVALLVSNEEHTILEAEQEDERTWYATMQVAGEENTRRIKISLDDSGVWMPSEVQP